MAIIPVDFQFETEFTLAERVYQLGVRNGVAVLESSAGRIASLETAVVGMGENVVVRFTWRPTDQSDVATEVGDHFDSATDASLPAVYLKAGPVGGSRCPLEVWAMERARACDIPVPRVLAHGGPHGKGRAWLLSEEAKGRPSAGDPLGLDDLGSHLARLHGVSVEGYGWLQDGPYLKSGTIRGEFSAWREEVENMVNYGLRELTTLGVLPRGIWFSSVLSHVPSVVEATCGPGRLLHGDVRLDHVFCQETGSLSGLIDFGDRRAGPAEWEFAVLMFELSPHQYALVHDAYLRAGCKLDDWVVSCLALVAGAARTRWAYGAGLHTVARQRTDRLSKLVSLYL